MLFSRVFIVAILIGNILSAKSQNMPGIVEDNQLHSIEGKMHYRYGDSLQYSLPFWGTAVLKKGKNFVSRSRKYKEGKVVEEKTFYRNGNVKLVISSEKYEDVGIKRYNKSGTKVSIERRERVEDSASYEIQINGLKHGRQYIQQMLPGWYAHEDVKVERYYHGKKQGVWYDRTSKKLAHHEKFSFWYMDDQYFRTEADSSPVGDYRFLKASIEMFKIDTISGFRIYEDSTFEYLRWRHGTKYERQFLYHAGRWNFDQESGYLSFECRSMIEVPSDSTTHKLLLFLKKNDLLPADFFERKHGSSFFSSWYLRRSCLFGTYADDAGLSYRRK